MAESNPITGTEVAKDEDVDLKRESNISALEKKVAFKLLKGIIGKDLDDEGTAQDYKTFVEACAKRSESGLFL